ncbi:hypothetical protein H6P81_005230 [Aristolochia fimbriata]|uniref:Uncharacterized protein n=1 Tax=Aristolochia fimbriata TaxID=158543 RepID=A0AAV7EXF3_ARIFI|nr:hypothetical protein H6P81_005230 [Aristolochia fimbriata]
MTDRSFKEGSLLADKMVQNKLRWLIWVSFSLGIPHLYDISFMYASLLGVYYAKRHFTKAQDVLSKSKTSISFTPS